jgi:sensor histidine kinase YesM
LKKSFSLSLYWKCQLIGWTVASLYWGYTGITSVNFDPLLGLLLFITDVGFCILITHLYRNFALRHQWQLLGLNQLLPRIIPSVIVLGLAFTVVTIMKLYFFKWWLIPAFQQPFAEFVRLNWQGIFVAGVRLMSIWLLAYHLYQYEQREIRIAKENARLAIITREAQLNNLSAQLNPHFLFNSLNNIKALVIENPESARRGIDLLSDILRTSLYSGDMMLTSVTKEIELVKDYLELEKLRFEERLQFAIKVDDELLTIAILRLSVQTLVENAIKHGIAKQKEGGLVCIRVEKFPEHICISVQNPGHLDIDQSVSGVGLKNLQERLELQYKGKATFTITGRMPGVVLATIMIPNL